MFGGIFIVASKAILPLKKNVEINLIKINSLRKFFQTRQNQSDGNTFYIYSSAFSSLLDLQLMRERFNGTIITTSRKITREVFKNVPIYFFIAFTTGGSLSGTTIEAFPANCPLEVPATAEVEGPATGSAFNVSAIFFFLSAIIHFQSFCLQLQNFEHVF